jgi:hypothetical protein
VPLPSKLGASNGPPCRILSANGAGIDVHVDQILSIKRSSKWERTEDALETGESLTTHRIRVPETLTLEIQCTNVEPFAGALLIFQRWERDHAAKTAERLLEAQAWDGELRVWSGKQYERTPAGTGVWILDEIDGPHLSGTESGVLHATLMFGESPRFTTAFTTATPEVGDELADVIGSPAERGRQSTTTVGADSAATIGASVFP